MLSPSQNFENAVEFRHVSCWRKPARIAVYESAVPHFGVAECSLPYARVGAAVRLPTTVRSCVSGAVANCDSTSPHRRTGASAGGGNERHGRTPQAMGQHRTPREVRCAPGRSILCAKGLDRQAIGVRAMRVTVHGRSAPRRLLETAGGRVAVPDVSQEAA